MVHNHLNQAEMMFFFDILRDFQAAQAQPLLVSVGKILGQDGLALDNFSNLFSRLFQVFSPIVSPVAYPFQASQRNK